MYKSKILGISILSAALLGLTGCASYDHKDYPRESWFTTSTKVIEADQFKKAENPLKVALILNYKWEGRDVIEEPIDKRTADWRERYGLWLASKRYLEEAGLFTVVDVDDKEKQGVITIDLARNMDEKTKKAIAAKKADPENHPDKIVYEYDMSMVMKLSLADGKTIEVKPVTDHMFIGHEDSEERKVGVEPKRFTFSYFNNMDFHTEFVRRFYKQMVFESVQLLEEKGVK